MSDGAQFGTWVRRHRKSMGLTQHDLARRVGCSESTIKKIEEGKRRPSQQVAELLVECLDVPTSERQALIRLARALPDHVPSLDGANGNLSGVLPYTPQVRRPNNLIAPPNAFIGREKEVQLACASLQRQGVRLLTLTGPPGIGKTRLSLQTATRLLDSFENGVYFIPLAAISDPRLVVSAVTQRLGVREAANKPLIESLKNYLRDKRMLLVLDNFEQVVSAAPLLGELLEEAPRLKILVTSRTVLHIYGEHELKIPPLALPDRKLKSPVEQLMSYESVELFVERALAVQPDFSVTEQNAASVVEICHRLDGLPLAIELAAARIRLFSPQTILERLAATPLQLLTGGPKNLPARQRTLHGAISWSYDMLDDAEQELFIYMSVFVSGCSLEAAEAVCEVQGPKSEVQGPKSKVQGPKSKVQGPRSKVQSPKLDLERSEGSKVQGPKPEVQSLALSEAKGSDSKDFGPWTLDLGLSNRLESLVDKSLLRQETQAGGELRFWMLETIRGFGLERLAESGEEEAIHRRHAAYYLELAERAEPELRGPHQAMWLDRLQAEHDNLRAALRWSEEHEYVEAGLRMSGALGWFWFRRGYLSEGREWLSTALAMPNPKQQVSDGSSQFKTQNSKFKIPARAKALLAAGRLAEHQGDKAQARALYEESLETSQELGDRQGVGHALCGLAFMSYREGNRDQARRLYEQALSTFRELNAGQGIAAAVRGLGDVALHEGDYPTARSLYAESLALFQEIGDKYSIATLLNGLGNVALDQGDYVAARSLYEEGLEIFRELGYKYGIAGSLLSLGEAARCQGDYAASSSLNEESLAIWRDLGEKWNMAMTLHNLGHAVHHRGDYKRAGAIFGEGLALFQEVGAKVGIAMCLAGLAGVAAEQKRPGRAARLLGAAEVIFQAGGVQLQAADLADYERNLASTRQMLDEASYNQAWEEGRAMPLEQAAAYALGVEG